MSPSIFLMRFHCQNKIFFFFLEKKKKQKNSQREYAPVVEINRLLCMMIFTTVDYLLRFCLGGDLK